MGVTVSDFEKWAINVKYSFTDKKEVVNGACIVPAPFCITRCINNARYLRSDEADMIVKKLSVRKPNVKFLQMFDAETSCDLTSQTPIVVVALWNIKHAGESFPGVREWVHLLLGRNYLVTRPCFWYYIFLALPEPSIPFDTVLWKWPLVCPMYSEWMFTVGYISMRMRKDSDRFHISTCTHSWRPSRKRFLYHMVGLNDLHLCGGFKYVHTTKLI